MRLGSATFIAGLALVVAGIVSSAGDPWRPGKADRRLAIELGGAEVLDYGASGVNIVVIQDRVDGELAFSEGTVEDMAQSTWRMHDNALVLDVRMRDGAVEGPILKVPPTLRRLIGDKMYVYTDVVAPAMRIDATSASWKGDAESLDVHARAKAKSLCDGGFNLVSDFHFGGGVVGTLRITMEGGSINLADLSQVGEVELHVGDDVWITLGPDADETLIRRLPFDGEPAVIDDDAGLPPYDSTCTQVP